METRNVELTPKQTGVLASLSEETGESISALSPNMPLERRSYWDLMQKYGKLVGLLKEKLRLHSLRH